MDQLTLTIIVQVICAIGPLLVLGLYIKRSSKQLIMGALEEVTEEFANIFEKPAVSKAMTVLGKQSGKVRASEALKTKFASNILDQYPALKIVLDKFGLEPLEALELWNDPMIGPFIQGMLGNMVKGNGFQITNNPVARSAVGLIT